MRQAAVALNPMEAEHVVWAKKGQEANGRKVAQASVTRKRTIKDSETARRLFLLWAGAVIGVLFIATPVKFLAPDLQLTAALQVGRVSRIGGS